MDIKEKTKNIIIDLGGVIIDVDMMCSFRRMESLGIDVKSMLVTASDNAASGKGAVVCDGLSISGVLEEYQEGKVRSDDFVAGALRMCGAGVTSAQVIDAWNACLFDIPESRLEVIRELRSKYTVSLLSNTNDIHWRYIVDRYFSSPGHTVDCFFDHVFLSHEIHLAKPRPEVYSHVLSVIGSDGSDCLFFDDSSANLEAAAAQGIAGYHAVDGLPLDFCRSLL